MEPIQPGSNRVIDGRGVKRRRDDDVRVDDGDNAPGGHACQSPSELKELAMPMLMEMLHASSTKDDGSAVVQLKAAALPMRVSLAHYTHCNFAPSMCVTLLNHGKFSGLALKMLSESVIGPGKEDSAAHMLSVSWALSYRSDQHKHVIMPPPHEVSVSRQDVLSEVAKLSSYSAVVLDAFWPTHNSVVYLSVLPRYPLCDLKTLLRYPWVLLPPGLIYIDPVTKRQTIRPVDRCNIAGGLLVAVQCLHGCKVLHNDIKPENCLLWYDKALDIIKVSLCDFDSAIVINSSLPGSPYKGTTCRYCPPECPGQHDQNRTDSKGDNWALACTLWELLYSTPNAAFDCCTENDVQGFTDEEHEPRCHRRARVLLHKAHMGNSCVALNTEATRLNIYAQGYRPKHFPVACSYLDAMFGPYESEYMEERPAIIPDEYVNNTYKLRDKLRHDARANLQSQQ